MSVDQGVLACKRRISDDHIEAASRILFVIGSKHFRELQFPVEWSDALRPLAQRLDCPVHLPVNRNESLHLEIGLDRGQQPLSCFLALPRLLCREERTDGGIPADSEQ